MLRSGWASMHALAKCLGRWRMHKRVESPLEVRERSFVKLNFVGAEGGAEENPRESCGGLSSCWRRIPSSKEASPGCKGAGTEKLGLPQAEEGFIHSLPTFFNWRVTG